MIDDSIKCIGVWHEHRLYYNGKHNDFFTLTPNFKVTRCPRRICDELADWCIHQMKKYLEMENKNGRSSNRYD